MPKMCLFLKEINHSPIEYFNVQKILYIRSKVRNVKTNPNPALFSYLTFLIIDIIVKHKLSFLSIDINDRRRQGHNAKARPRCDSEINMVINTILP